MKGVSPESLEDTRVAGVERPWVPGMFLAPEESATVPNNGEIQLNLTEIFYFTNYLVKEGDNVSTIASKFSLSQGSIIALNKLENAWDIKIGLKLKIPNMDGIPYIVQKNDTISKIAIKMKVPENAILDANEMLNDKILPGQELFIPGARMSASDLSSAIRPKTAETSMMRPLAGKVTSGYGWREDPVRPQPGVMRFHSAVDISGKMGDPVKAAMKGTVLHIANNPNLGNFIILKHGEYQTLYAHLSAFSVRHGDAVEQGQEIGKVGDTGYTTGPHLHFEVFHNGNRVNPLDLLK
jgi:murein DD-endopeptidase MepM/ murein hydrolase activator NlpD